MLAFRIYEDLQMNMKKGEPLKRKLDKIHEKTTS